MNEDKNYLDKIIDNFFNSTTDSWDKLKAFLIFPFLIPIGFIFLALGYDEINMSQVGQIGDIIGGIANPLISIVAILLTFFAFYMQLKANQQVQKQFKIQQFENQFYEMLRLHKENVKEIEYETNLKDTSKGRQAFYDFYQELKICYDLMNSEENKKNRIERSYAFFYSGEGISQYYQDVEKDTNLFSYFKENREEIEKFTYSNQRYNTVGSPISEIGSYLLHCVRPKSFILGHYYRHLYQTVSMVVHNKDLYYPEKRNYLKQLRAQLSEYEQIMLFYNWLSGQSGGYFGAYWEQREIKLNENNTVEIQRIRDKSKNYYFTDYRMIKNVFSKHMFEEYGRKVYNYMYDCFEPGKDYEMIEGKEKDNLFDNQDFD